MVARAAGEGPALVAQEAAGALVAFGDDPAGLVTACRRLVDRQPTSGPMWWLAARVLCSTDPTQEAWRAVEQLQDDQTSEQVSAALPEGAIVTVVGLGEHTGEALVRRGDLEVLLVDNDAVEPHLIRRLQRTDTMLDAVPAAGLGAAVAMSDLVVFEVSAMGPSGMVAPAGSRAELRVSPAGPPRLTRGSRRLYCAPVGELAAWQTRRARTPMRRGRGASAGVGSIGTRCRSGSCTGSMSSALPCC